MAFLYSFAVKKGLASFFCRILIRIRETPQGFTSSIRNGYTPLSQLKVAFVGSWHMFCGYVQLCVTILSYIVTLICLNLFKVVKYDQMYGAYELHFFVVVNVLQKRIYLDRLFWKVGAIHEPITQVLIIWKLLSTL